MTIERVGVVGGGLMGSGIAEVCAAAGCDVIVREIDEEACAAARERLETSVGRAVKSGKCSADAAEELLARVSYTSDFGDFADRHLVIEAVIEDEDLKHEVFSTLDKVVEAPDAILASNTSSIPIAKLAMATGRPEAVMGLHFFNPAPVQRLVELIPSIRTDPELAEKLEAFARDTLHKNVVRAQDRAGFVVNSLLVPFLLSAIRELEAGFATAVDIDTGMVDGCGHPMGPLALCDLIGLDTIKFVADSMYDEYKEPLYAAPPLLSRMVQAGLLGRKTKRGFYEY